MPERFWAKVDATGGPEACWPWRAGRHKQGYGRFTPPGGPLSLAHRVACELAHGPAPTGIDALHACDNPPCCNPAHLRWATHAENMRDMLRRGRSGRAVLAAADVLAIRSAAASGVQQRMLAAAFNVSPGTICNIVNQQTWRFL